MASWIGLRLVDPERAPLALGLLVVLVPDVDLRPDAAHQQAVELPQVVLGDVDVLVPEVDQLGPVLVVVGEVADLHLVDEGVLALVLDQRLGLVRLVGPDEVRGDRGVDHPQPGVDGGGVVGGAILAEQVLQDEDRHVGPDLHLADEILADHLAREDRRGFLVQIGHGVTFTSKWRPRSCQRSRQFRPAGGVEEVDAHGLLGDVLADHQGDGVRLDLLWVVRSATFSLTSPVASSKP